MYDSNAISKAISTKSVISRVQNYVNTIEVKKPKWHMPQQKNEKFSAWAGKSNILV